MFPHRYLVLACAGRLTLLLSPFSPLSLAVFAVPFCCRPGSTISAPGSSSHGRARGKVGRLFHRAIFIEAKVINAIGLDAGFSAHYAHSQLLENDTRTIIGPNCLWPIACGASTSNNVSTEVFAVHDFLDLEDTSRGIYNLTYCTSVPASISSIPKSPLKYP